MPRKKRVGIKEIAQEAGVSISVVSTVLNNKQGNVRVSDQTRARVHEAADKLGYRANIFASALRSNRTGVIGMLNPNFGGTYLNMLTHELMLEANRRGITLFAGIPELDPDKLEGQLSKIETMLFDGLLLVSDASGYQQRIRELERLNKPFVAVRGTNTPPYVDVDQAIRFEITIDYLQELGHTRIAYLISRSFAPYQDRISLFRQSMVARDIPIADDYVISMEALRYAPHGQEFEANVRRVPAQYAQKLMALSPPPTAIVCDNDGIAVVVVGTLLRMGFHVPEDVSIIGSGNESMTDMFYPRLTTLSHRMDRITSEALDLLMRLVENPDDNDAREARILIEPELIERETCGPPKEGEIL